ncbi:helix-turn-helix domain-containing protein [Thermodesulfobacteriota bacterium]
MYSENATTKKYVNQLEAANYLGIAKSTISMMTSRGDLTHYRLGRAVRYTIADLDNYMESRRVSGACEELGRKAG